MRIKGLQSTMAVAALLISSQLYGQGVECICNGYNNARSFDGSFTDSPDFERARATLRDPAFFGATGVVDRLVLVGSGVQTFSGMGSTNIFFTGRVATSSYTTTERNALTNAVLAGMNLVIMSDDTQNDLSAHFGFTLENAGAEENVVAAPQHPIFAGPFGRVTRFRNPGESAHFRSWPAGTQVLATSDAGPTMLLIPRGKLGLNSGAILAIAGVDTLSTAGRSQLRNDSSPDLPVTDALLLNIVSHLCNPSLPANAPHLVFPQFANGDDNVSYLNLTSTDQRNLITATVEFRDDDGLPFEVNIVGLGGGWTFQSTIRPNETGTFKTDGAAHLKSGWASVRGSANMTGTVIFHVPAPTSGATGVAAGEVAGGIIMPVVQQPVLNSSTGVVEAKDVPAGFAVCNLSAKATELRLELWDSYGKRADGIAFLTLPPYGHIARYLSQLYPSFDFRNFKGSLRVVSSRGLIAGTGLQLGNASGQFTALPVKGLY